MLTRPMHTLGHATDTPNIGHEEHPHGEERHASVLALVAVLQPHAVEEQHEHHDVVQVRKRQPAVHVGIADGEHVMAEQVAHVQQGEQQYGYAHDGVPASNAVRPLVQSKVDVEHPEIRRQARADVAIRVSQVVRRERPCFGIAVGEPCERLENARAGGDEHHGREHTVVQVAALARHITRNEQACQQHQADDVRDDN